MVGSIVLFTVRSLALRMGATRNLVANEKFSANSENLGWPEPDDSRARIHAHRFHVDPASAALH